MSIEIIEVHCHLCEETFDAYEDDYDIYDVVVCPDCDEELITGLI